MYTTNVWVKCPCCDKSLMVEIQYNLPNPTVRKVYDSPIGSQSHDNNKTDGGK